jgi:hydrogenase-4 component B
VTGWLLGPALALFAAAGLFDLVAGTGGRSRPAPYLASAAGSALLVALGAAGLGRPARTIGPDLLGAGGRTFLLDRLSGLFLVGAFAAAAFLSLIFASWARQHDRGRGLAAGYALVLLSTAGVLLAANVFAFLFAFELLTGAFYVLTARDRSERQRVPASFLTAAFGKLSGSLLLIGMLLLADASHTLAFAGLAHQPPSAARAAAYWLLVAGFGAKVGLAPLQVWMPSGYAAATGPARAAMSGVAVNVGLYGLWRTLSVLGRPPLGLVVVLLVAASFTALLGIAHAAVQPDLQRVVAYSSVENGGLILTGFGVALAGASTGQPRLEAVGLLAATLQATTHTFAKTALFASAATIADGYGTSQLDRIRGAGRQLPWSGTAFGVAACTLAGLPPTVGFLSEWFLLEALLQQFRVHGLALHLAMATAGALLALTVGFAALTFLRLLGLTVLGKDPDRAAAAGTGRGTDVGYAGRAGLAGLMLGCLGLAAVAPLTVRVVADGIAPVVPAAVTRGALLEPWVLTSVYRPFSVISPSWLWVTLPVGIAGLALLVLLVTRGGYLRTRRVPAWRSASPGVAGGDRYTSFAFATPTRHVLAGLLHSRHELAEEEREPGRHLAYRTDVVEVTERYFYRPLGVAVLRVVRLAKRLQSGRLDAYVGYLLLVVVAVLAVVAALGAR